LQAGRAAWAGFTYGWPDGSAQSFAIADDVAASIAETNARIQSLAPALLSPSVRMAASTRAEPVKLGSRAHAGRIYVIAVNSYDIPVRWSGDGLPGLGKQRVTVVGEGRTLVARAGRLADAFAPLGVHVYSFVPARSVIRVARGEAMHQAGWPTRPVARPVKPWAGRGGAQCAACRPPSAAAGIADQSSQVIAKPGEAFVPPVADPLHPGQRSPSG
jgi:hypothetical protein